MVATKFISKKGNLDFGDIFKNEITYLLGRI